MTTTGTNWADPVHDAAGNMTTIPQPQTPSSSYTLKYDAWNRLVEVKDGSTVVQANEYDGLNRRIIRDETGGSGDKIHFYYSQQWQVLEERKEVSGTEDPDPLAQYLYHPDYVDAIAVRYYDADTDGAGIVEHYYLQDANFNVTAVTNDAGAVVERYAYTPYGEVTFLDLNFANPASSSTIDNELLYTGRRLDPETGLQLNRWRYYASHLGRWVNRDPIGYFGGGMNLYGYVGSNPTFFTDPSGLWWSVPTWITQGEGVPPAPDPSEMCKSCPECCDCIEELIEDANEFEIPFEWPACENWQIEFIKDQRDERKECKDCYQSEPVCWWYPAGTPGTNWWLSHCAVKVTLCDGTEFYLDNGWWGGQEGDDNYFEPWEIPPWVSPW